MIINISSEIGALQSVIVHTPGREVSLVNPEIKEQLLFDDIIFEDDARVEHLDMLEIFKIAMSQKAQILEITDLFKQSLNNDDAKAYFVEQLVKEFPEENLYIIEKDLLELSADDLVAFTVTGVLPHIKGFNMNPSPNLMFTRDLAAVVNSSVLLSRAAEKARLRESLIMETLVMYHPLFDSVKEKAIRISGHQSIEGGDVLVVSSELVLIGMSVRTSFTGLMKAAKELLLHGVKTVLAVDIPKQRASMHLDTIFTFSGIDECVAFPPAIMETHNNVVALQLHNDKVETELKFSLQEALKEFTGTDYSFIKCGGEDKNNQYREQWTDGANVFALAPGIIVGYERNIETFNAFAEHGYLYMNQFEFIEEFGKTGIPASNKQKLAVSFQGHELCRGRGGARCMTLPLSRAPINN